MNFKRASILGAALLALTCARPALAQTQPIQYYYDDLGRLVTVVDQSGDVITYTYDPVGNILSIGRSTVTAGSLAIFDFNPQSGPIGISVTIRGQGFSATASSDTVKFNGTVATVTSATASTLVATVPTGATTGPISVTVRKSTATSSTNFTVTTSLAPVITSVFPQSALSGVVVSGATVTGISLLGATFSFIPTGGPTVSAISVGPTGTSATMTFSAGSTAGTYTLIAGNAYGNSGVLPTETNEFTVVSPTSAALSACGAPDVEEAAYGLNPLNPNSCVNGSQIPLAGEADALFFSVLNTAVQEPSTSEADAVFFSVLNTSPPVPSTSEADAICFSVWNDATSAPPGLACANAAPDGPEFKGATKKGASHASKTSSSQH